MPSFLAQLQALDTSGPQSVQAQLEPRRVRRQKARDAAKSNRSVGTAAVPDTSVLAKKENW